MELLNGSTAKKVLGLFSLMMVVKIRSFPSGEQTKE